MIFQGFFSFHIFFQIFAFGRWGDRVDGSEMDDIIVLQATFHHQ